MTTVTNQERADRAAKVILDYGADRPDVNLIDMLTDAMHWCVATGYAFELCLLHARYHFDAEK
jgi:hypothetical protein